MINLVKRLETRRATS